MNYWPVVEPISFSLILNNAELPLKHCPRVRRLGMPGCGRNRQARRSAARCDSKILTAVVLLVCCATACSHNQRADTSEVAAQTVSSSPTPVASDASPRRSSDSRLTQVLDPLLDRSDFANARWGVAVMSLRDGNIIYERNGAKLFTPASNMKIYTTAVALDLLGADYHWRTSVYSSAEPDASGTIRGDLVLYGRGAPDLVSTNRKENANSLEELAQALFERGVRRVEGKVIGDDSYFRGAINQWQ